MKRASPFRVGGVLWCDSLVDEMAEWAERLIGGGVRARDWSNGHCS